jgi:hypothetical protein
MSRIVKREWRSLEAVNGQRNCWALDYIHQGWIAVIVVKQVAGFGGILQDFRIKVFDSKRPCEGGSASSGGPAGNDPDGYYEADPELYTVIEGRSSPSGEYRFSEPTGIPFRNRDGDQTNPEYKLYLEIVPEKDAADLPAVGSTSVYDVTISGWVDVG